MENFFKLLVVFSFFFLSLLYIISAKNTQRKEEENAYLIASIALILIAVINFFGFYFEKGEVLLWNLDCLGLGILSTLLFFILEIFQFELFGQERFKLFSLKLPLSYFILASMVMVAAGMWQKIEAFSGLFSWAICLPHAFLLFALRKNARISIGGNWPLVFSVGGFFLFDILSWVALTLNDFCHSLIFFAFLFTSKCCLAIFACLCLLDKEG